MNRARINNLEEYAVDSAVFYWNTHTQNSTVIAYHSKCSEKVQKVAGY